MYFTAPTVAAHEVYLLKNHILTTLFWQLFGNTSAQCFGNFIISSNGIGGNTLKAITSSDTSNTAVYNWSIYSNSQIIFVDSNTLQTHFQFDTNGTYQVCMQIMDTSGPCSFDTCKAVQVRDAVYHPMLDSVNIWHLIINLCFEAQPHGGGTTRSDQCNVNPNSNQFFTGGDTIYNSVHYKPIYDQLSNCSPGYLREDVATRKIYFTYAIGKPEILLYDFSLQIGDSVLLSYQPVNYYNTSADSGFWHLDSIGAAHISVGTRRAFFLSRKGNSMSWLEGTGSLAHPLYLFEDQFGYGCSEFFCNSNYLMVPYRSMSFLSCFSHTNFVYFDTCAYLEALSLQGGCFAVFDSCDYGVVCGAVNEIAALASFKIFPNPATNEAVLQLNVVQGDNFSIILHDLQGKQLMAEKELGWLSDGQHSAVINLQGLSAGFYLIECRTIEGSVYSKLVVL